MNRIVYIFLFIFNIIVIKNIYDILIVDVSLGIVKTLIQLSIWNLPVNHFI